jgi:quinol monooxygenase YgiN
MMFKNFISVLLCAIAFNGYAQTDQLEKNFDKLAIQLLNTQEITDVNMENVISLYGTIYPQKDKIGELRSELLSLVHHTRKEEGSLIFNVHEEENGSFFLYEVWRSQEDLDRHWQKPYLKEFMVKLENMLDRNIEPHSGKLLNAIP